jgi:serine/threonine-protein kinase
LGDEALIRSLLEEALNSGRGPEDVCIAHPELLKEVRTRLRRIQNLAEDLERVFPSPGRQRGWPRSTAHLMGPTNALPSIPGYELKSMIGHGGMGVVYEARHLKLDRDVAVKMLIAGDYAPAKELAGLLLEARAIAGLGHPHIVEVYDAGEVNGLPYFTMELVGGGSLAQRLGGVPMPPREAAALVERLAAAVQVAHEKGVVHRDLKPANVLLTPDGTPKISDFGLARRLEAGNSLGTMGAARVGTPSYMGPEQALGTPDAFQPLVDVYSLGAILYETLTGRPPFRADSPLETQRQVISEEPVPPSRINRRVPRDLETICLKCLQKSPSARYASADRLSQDLRRYLNGEPISARRTGTFVRGVKWARRHPTTTTMLSFGALVATAAMIVGAWYLATAAASRRAIESDLGEVEHAQRASDWATANSALDRAAVHLGGRGPDDLRSRLDAAKRNAGFVTRLDAVRMARALGSGTPASYARSNRDYAALYQVAGVGIDTDPPDQTAARLRSSNISAALIAGMYDWLSNVRTDLHRRDWILATLTIVDSDHGGWRDRSRDTTVWKDPRAVRQLFAEFRVDGQPTEYLLWFAALMRDLGNDSTPLFRKIQAEHSNDFWANYVLADALRARGQNLEAMRFVQAAIAIRPEVAAVHNDLGNCLDKLYRFDEAIDQFREAVRLDPKSAEFYGSLGQALYKAGRYAEAIEQLETGLREVPDHVKLHLNLGQVLTDLDRDSEALAQFKQAGAVDSRMGDVREALMAALIRARRGPEAIAIFRSWLNRSAGSYWEWDGLAEVCMAVGAVDDYREIRTRMLESFADSTNPFMCEQLGRACLLAPIPEDQWAAANTLVDRTLESERRQRTWRYPCFKVSKALSEYRGGHAEDALSLINADVSKVLGPMPQLVRALALSDLHRDAEALAALAQAGAMFDWRLSAAVKRESWIFHALRHEAELKILPNLDAFARGAYWPTTAQERLALIGVGEDRGMHLATARLFSEAFAADAALAEDVESQCRFRAACAAAACGCGRSTDGGEIAPEEQARWRKQSLEWLRADLTSLRDATAKRRESLAKWRTDPDLRGFRDPEFLATLPEAERSRFRTLWADVDGLLASPGDN